MLAQARQDIPAVKLNGICKSGARQRNTTVDEDIAGSRAVEGGVPSWFSSDETVAGTPAEVAENLISQCDRTGAGNVLIYGGVPLSRPGFTNTVELYGRDVPAAPARACLVEGGRPSSSRRLQHGTRPIVGNVDHCRVNGTKGMTSTPEIAVEKNVAYTSGERPLLWGCLPA